MDEKKLQSFMKKVDKRPLPKGWDKFVNKITSRHSVIYKNKSICTCLNCNNTFDTGKLKIDDIAVCPHCKNKYPVMGNSLYYRGYSYEKSVVICQRFNKQIVLRIFEICTYFNIIHGKMETSTQEYARVILGVGTYLGSNISFYMGHQHVYYCKDIYWRPYNGIRNYAIYEAYPYSKKRLIKGTIMEYAPIDEFLSEYSNYNYLSALCIAAYPSFEMLWKMGLKNLSQYSYHFKKTGSFKNVLGVPKNFLPFMVQNNINFRELQVLRIIKEPNIQAIKEFKYYNINRLRNLANSIPVTKHIPLTTELLKCQEKDLQYVLKFTKLNKLIKYKQILNNFRTYKDYLSFIKELGFDMHNSKYLFPKDLLESHNKFEAELEIKKNIQLIYKIYEQFLDLSHFIYEDNKYIIFPAPSFESFEEESRMQNNCVRRYAKNYADCETEIYFMREKVNINESLVTVEYNHRKIIQAKQYHNTEVTNEQSKFLEKWIKFRNRKKNIKFEKSNRTLFVA